VVTGLDQSNFQMSDEKTEQQIVSFSTKHAPIALGVSFDYSSSMADKIEKSKEAALQFLRHGGDDHSRYA
jgi:hypothetical protein